MDDALRRRIETLLGLWLPSLALWTAPANAALPPDPEQLRSAERPQPLVFDNLWERAELQRYAAHRSHSSHASHASHSSHYSSSGGGYSPPAPRLYSPPAPSPISPPPTDLRPHSPPPPLYVPPSPPAVPAYRTPPPVGESRGGTDQSLGPSRPSGTVGPSAQELASMVRAVQLALIARGYEPGPIDGKLGPTTRRALEQYQRESGFPPTGRLDARTLSSLGILGLES